MKEGVAYCCGCKKLYNDNEMSDYGLCVKCFAQAFRRYQENKHFYILGMITDDVENTTVTDKVS